MSVAVWIEGRPLERAHLRCSVCGRQWSVRSWQGPLREVANREATRHEERCVLRESEPRGWAPTAREAAWLREWPG
jgi:hypothetical protein